MSKKLSTYDLESHAFKADPHLTYAAMRRDAPLCRVLRRDEANSFGFLAILRVSRVS